MIPATRKRTPIIIKTSSKLNGYALQKLNWTGEVYKQVSALLRILFGLAEYLSKYAWEHYAYVFKTALVIPYNDSL
jgi:hypothetical protein